MLSPLFDLMQQGNIKKVNLCLSVDSIGKPVVTIQAAPNMNPTSDAVHPQRKDKDTNTAQIYAALSQPLCLTADNTDEIDIILAQDIVDFANSLGVTINNTNIKSLLDAHKKAQETIINKSPVKSTNKQNAGNTKPVTTKAVTETLPTPNLADTNNKPKENTEETVSKTVIITEEISDQNIDEDPLSLFL